MRVFRGRGAAISFAAAVPLILTACGDSRIGNLSTGIGRDSALKVLCYI